MGAGVIERSAAAGQPALRLLVHTIRYQRLPAFEKIYIKNFFFQIKKVMAVILGEKSYLTVMENLKWAIYVVHRMHQSS